MPGKHGTRLNGVPPYADMRQARQQQRFMAIIDVTTDPAIGACRVALENIAAGRKLGVYRGRPLNTEQLLAALAALEQGGVPLCYNANGHAVRTVAKELRLDTDAARSLLRRLVNLRKRLGC